MNRHKGASSLRRSSAHVVVVHGLMLVWDYRTNAVTTRSFGDSPSFVVGYPTTQAASSTGTPGGHVVELLGGGNHIVHGLMLCCSHPRAGGM
jgi:hypothetical protein